MIEFNIPKGWIITKLGLIMKTGTGSVNPANFPDEEFDLYSIPAYDLRTPEKLKGSNIGSSKKIVQENDVLLSRIVPHIQRSWIVGAFEGRRQIGSGEWIIFDGNSLCKLYLRFYLLSYDFHQKFMKTISGVGGSLTRANPNQTANFDFPLPPLAEQERIVAKIEELFSELDKGIETLKTAQQQLKVYRQAVLKYAFEGKLTNPDVKEGELPEGWAKATFQDVSTKIGDIDHKMPSKVENGVFPYLSTGDITDENKLDFDRCKLISKDDFLRLSKKIKPQKGDIIFPRYGTIGRNVLVQTEIDFLVSYSCAIIKPDNSKIDSNYFYHYTLSSLTNKEIKKHIVQTTQANVGIASIKSFLITFPESIYEQKKVVQEIESRLSVCDKIEESIVQGLQQAEALRQSILKKAFEGKLVPQDPNDEPASVLLERIKAERQKVQPEKKIKTKKVKA